MYIPNPVLTILLQILTTPSLAIDISAPNSLIQDQLVTPNTTLLASQFQPPNPTDRYYVDCERVTSPPPPGLNPSHCLDAAPIICNRLTQTRPVQLVRKEWTWVELPGCALGYFLPGRSELPGPEGFPSTDECNGDIYGMIIERCGFRSQYNTGSINVAQLPEGTDPGLPMTHGYPRYVMAPERL